MRRFIIPSHAVFDDTITITGDLFHHIAHVLRLKRGTRIILADGNGREYEGTISQVTGESIAVTTEETRTAPATGTGPRITLFQGLPKGDKLEHILQKCTELG
ncbi:MAG TPA: RsmE family RNA methyltransferase, partial [Geobacteraceae bacterium]|nr:RsmE family RNA methyltransferase [Geobacteraceae bacterium]